MEVVPIDWCKLSAAGLVEAPEREMEPVFERSPFDVGTRQVYFESISDGGTQQVCFETI